MYNLFKKILPALKSVFFGTSTAVVSTDVQNKTYIKFNIESEHVTTFDNAQLHLIIAENGSGVKTIEVYGLNDGVAGETWNENTITFDNAPANQSGNGIDLATATLLGSFSVSAAEAPGTLKIFSSTDMLTWLNADGNNLVTFILRRTDGNTANLAFASKESSTYAGPKLVVNMPMLNLVTTGKDNITSEELKLFSHGY